MCNLPVIRQLSKLSIILCTGTIDETLYRPLQPSSHAAEGIVVVCGLVAGCADPGKGRNGKSGTRGITPKTCPSSGEVYCTTLARVD
jgi:hypothetical protein